MPIEKLDNTAKVPLLHHMTQRARAEYRPIADEKYRQAHAGTAARMNYTLSQQEQARKEAERRARQGTISQGRSQSAYDQTVQRQNEQRAKQILEAERQAQAEAEAQALLTATLPTQAAGTVMRGVRNAVNGNEHPIADALATHGSNQGLFELSESTKNWAKEHPHISGGVNLVGDFVLPTTLTMGTKAATYSRPIVTSRLASAMNQSVKNAVTPRELFPGQIGWAPRQSLTGYHASEAPILKFDYNFPNWAIITHNAPKGIYFTANETAPSGGFLAKRPYIQQVQTTLDRPMVQVGEVPAVSKNATRNQIEQMAMDRGADGIIYDGIADNQLKGQTIVKTLNPDVNVNIITRSKQLTPEEYAGIPKGERNSPTPYQQMGTATEPQSVNDHIEVNGERFGPYISHGSEQAVFEDTNDVNKVLKVQTGQGFKSIEDIRQWHPHWFKRNQIGNIQVPMKFEGYLQGNNRIYPVYSQQRLKPLGNFAPLQFERQVLPLIDLQFQRYGYNPNLRTNGFLHYGDIKPENLGFDSNGNIRFFDLDVYKNGGLVRR